MSHFRRTLRGDGHSATDWCIGGFVQLQTAVRILFIRIRPWKWAAASCAALPTANADSTQLLIVNCCSGFPVSSGI